MVYKKGDRLIVNHQRKGQFLVTVDKEFDTEKDTWAELKPVDGEVITARISFCKFKPYTGKEL